VIHKAISRKILRHLSDCVLVNVIYWVCFKRSKTVISITVLSVLQTSTFLIQLFKYYLCVIYFK